MRLIDADALGIGLCNPDVFMDRAYAAGWNGVVRLLQSAPTITPESLVRHGRWRKAYKSGNTVTDGYVSSCCDMWNERKSPYCSHCGAKMDLEE